jgi:hypothetical protein
MSSFHAGYAATVCVKQKTAQDILHIYYADGDIPATFTRFSRYRFLVFQR